MEFRQRKIAFEKLKGASHLEADRTLLRELDPNNSLLKRVMKTEKLQAEILWEVLGFEKVSHEMVVQNRRKLQKPQGPTPEELVKAEAEKELIDADLDTMSQPQMAQLSKKLKMITPNLKAATLRPALAKYRDEMPKVDEGDGNPKTEVPTDPEKVNELEEENHELKEQKEELEEQNEELQDKVDEMEGEKKNTPAE